MSKTIDVRPGDTWTGLDDGKWFYQHRDGWCICMVNENGVLTTGINQDRVPGEFDVPSDYAKARIVQWGYTITRDDGKVEGGRTISEAADAAISQIHAIEAKRDEAKPADVPTCAVHLRSDAHLSAVIGRVNGIADWMYTLESRLAAVTESAADARQIADNVSDRVDELLERVQALEKPADKDAATREIKSVRIEADGTRHIEYATNMDKDAARVVKAPKNVGVFSGSVGHELLLRRDNEWRTALIDAGIKVEAAE